jgi:hypothetical protein
MGFYCPDCSTTGRTLEIISSIELPADSRSDEIALQLVRCSRCRLEAVAVYEESRRGLLSGESTSHVGYRVGDAVVREIRRLIRSCPARSNPRCTCPGHRELSKADAAGRGSWAAKLAQQSSFEMRI